MRSKRADRQYWEPAMTPRRYGPLAYVPINRRPPLSWPNGQSGLWVNPNVEFFGLDDVMPSNLNHPVPRDQVKIPNVHNLAVRLREFRQYLAADGGVEPIRHPRQHRAQQRVWDHHPEIIEEGNRLGWEWIGH